MLVGIRDSPEVVVERVRESGPGETEEDVDKVGVSTEVLFSA